jgi:hypothetical protein
MDNDSESVADAMNRGMFLAPDLIGEGDEDPLLEQAEKNAEDDFVRAEERDEERKARKPKP